MSLAPNWGWTQRWPAYLAEKRAEMGDRLREEFSRDPFGGLYRDRNMPGMVRLRWGGNPIGNCSERAEIDVIGHLLDVLKSLRAESLVGRNECTEISERRQTETKPSVHSFPLTGAQRKTA